MATIAKVDSEKEIQNVPEPTAENKQESREKKDRIRKDSEMSPRRETLREEKLAIRRERHRHKTDF